MSQPFRTWAILGLVVVLGCSSAAAGELTIEGADGNDDIPISREVGTEWSSDQAQPAVDRATADLVERVGVSAADITVTKVEAQTWSDVSLGCPEPGRLYAQVLVDGFRILVSVGDDHYEYHSGQGRVVPCPV